MSRIVRVVNAMISNSELISESMKSSMDNKLLFFKYKKKYVWSIWDSYDDYYLTYYPGDISVQTFVGFSEFDWAGYSDMVVYSTRDLNSSEAHQSFSELYTIVKEKLYGVSEVLDDILNDEDHIPF